MKVEEELALVRQRKNKVKALMNEATRKHEEEKMKYRDKMIGFNSRWDSLDSDEARLLRLAQGGRPTNGHKANGFRTPDAESDEDDAVFVTPVQRGRSGRYEDSGESDEDSDGDSQERPLPSRPRQDDDYMSEDEDDEELPHSSVVNKIATTSLVPREVAVRQQRAAATMAPPPGFGAPAPPGFEQQTPCAPSGAAPPGFDKRSPPGFSRSRPANGTQEDRGAAQLRHNDLRNLLASKRAAAAPPSEGGSVESAGNSIGPGPPRRLQTPAAKQGDLREHLTRMRMGPSGPPKNGPPNGRAPENGRPHFDTFFPAPKPSEEDEAPAPPPRPRGAREWDAGKSEFGEEAQPPPPPLPPPQRAQRSGRQEGGVYQPPRREWDADAEQRGASPDQGWDRREQYGTVIGRSDAEYAAPDPAEGGVIDFDDFPGLAIATSRPEWDGDAAKMEENFPALGAGPAAAPKGAWGAGDTAAKLQKLSVQAAEKPAAPKVDVVALELTAGLRLQGDTTTDVEKRQQMRSKRNFVFDEVVKRRGPPGTVNVVQGLELHKGLLNAQEQARVVGAIESWVEAGRAGLLRGRTFSAPRKHMKGKGRVTVQFGCCYNYAIDREGREPGIIAEEVVEPMPPMLQALVHRLVRWGVMPRSKAPDSAIINIYDQEDCIPPHIDHHDFSRPFCTISLLSEQAIMFGAKLIPLGPGKFGGNHCTIPLPVGSCLVLKGNGADVAMHCVPPVSQRRMSITLRKMGDRHADRVRKEVERIARNPRVTSRWADDEVQESPRRYGADDYDDGDGGRPRQRRVVW